MFKTFIKSLIFIFIAQCDLFSIAAQIKTCRLGTLSGNQPELLCRLSNDFITKRNSNIKSFVLLLHGPSGNGKSAIAKEFAKVTNAQFNYYAGSNIVTAFQGSGAEKIKEIFQEAKKASTNQVIFIDEFDAIASQNAQNQRDENQLAFQQFNTELDAIKNNPKIFVICATNYFEKIPTEIKRRFRKNICLISNPNESNRENLIATLFIKNNSVKIDTSFLQELIEKINKQPNGNDLVKQFDSIISCLNEIATLEHSSILKLLELKNEIAHRVDTISTTVNYLTQFYQLTTSEGQLINNEFKVFKLNIEALIAQLNVYISRYDLFNEENLQCLIKETNGLCVGDCEGIYECLQVKIEEENSLQISIQDLEQIIAPFTNELKEKQNAQLQKLESEKKANERQAIDDQNRNMTNKATKFGLLATGAAAGGAVAGTINATAAGLITTQTITVASPLVAKAALTKVAAAAMAAGKPIIAKTIAAKAASITAAKTGSIVIAKELAGKAAITALIPGVQVVILGACVGVGVYAAYKFFIE